MKDFNVRLRLFLTVLIPAAMKSIMAAFLSRISNSLASKMDQNTLCTLSTGHKSLSCRIASSTNTDIMLE